MNLSPKQFHPDNRPANRSDKKSDNRFGANRLRALILGIPMAALIIVTNGGQFNPLVLGLGGGVGALLALQVPVAGQLLTGRAGGYAVTAVSLGTGRRLGALMLRGVPVTVRLPLPLVTVIAVPVAQPGLRRRIWLSAVLPALLNVGFGSWLAFGTGGFPSALGIGFIFSTLSPLTLGGLPMSAGWLLRLPFLPPSALEPFALRPAEAAAALALGNGRVSDARAALADEVPSTFAGHRLLASIALAEGDHTTAAREARSSVDLAPHLVHAAISQMLLAAALVDTVETGERTADEVLSGLTRAILAAGNGQPALIRFFPARADAALLGGRPADALKLARPPAAWALDALWWARAECTLAAALAANGRPEDARAALERARSAMPELARIATVATMVGG